MPLFFLFFLAHCVDSNHRQYRDRLPNGKVRLPNGKDRLPNGKDRLPNGKDRLPNGKDRLPNDCLCSN